MKNTKKIALVTLIGLFAASVVVSFLGSRTIHYNCKYVNKMNVLVADHEKYMSAAYEIDYNDNTKGYVSALDEYAAQGIDRGAVCETVWSWGFPYNFTNRNINDESSVRSK